MAKAKAQEKGRDESLCIERREGVLLMESPC